MKEINLLKNYPITKRNLDEALVERTDEVREKLRENLIKIFLMEKGNMAMEVIIIILNFGWML